MKKILLSITLMGLMSPIFSQKMSLQERRIKLNVEQNQLPNRQKEFKELIENGLELTVNWESFEKGSDWLQLNHQCWGRVLDAMQAVAKDELGRTALQSVISIHTMHMKASEKRLLYEDGVITIAGDWTGSLSGIFSVPVLIDFLTDNL